MAQRILPGAYVSLNDMSQLPEGQTALTVGYVVNAKRGPVNTLNLVTDGTDFLTKYTFAGKPSISDDKTFFSILKVLAKTNQLYVSRAANNPLYGAVVLQAANELGTVTSVAKGTKTFTVSGDITEDVNPGDRIMVYGSKENKTEEDDVDGTYTVSSVAKSGQNTKVVVTQAIEHDFPVASSGTVKMYIAPGTPLLIANVNEFLTGGIITFVGDLSRTFKAGFKFVIRTSEIEENNKEFTVEASTFDEVRGITTVAVTEVVTPGEGSGKAYFNGLEDPDNYTFGKDDLMLITGVDQGAYNNDIALEIRTSIDFPDDFVYVKGAMIGGQECTFDTMQLVVKDGNTGYELESFLFSRDPEAKTIDGISLYVDSVVSGSAYIKIKNNEDADNSLLPQSTFSNAVYMTGGSDGGEVTAETLQAALEPFRDKTTTLSILGNGCSTAAETITFQQALMGVADDRKDLVVFLNNPADTENKTLNSAKAQAIVDYKKKDLANTSFYGCMYAPHVNTSDTFNQRQVKIGAEAVAIAGWLDVINNLNYPYAYAGPRNGLVQGVTCDWKIGDMSGEAQLLNDASINYVAYDGKVGRYYMQAQNTLQIANSSMRNIGTVLNVLDIKEHFVTSLKEYIQLPITADLRRDIIDTANDYLSPMVGVRFSNYSFQDVTSDHDLADNTLRYLLTIAPTPYAQRIYLVMNVVNAAFDFSILQSM